MDIKVALSRIDNIIINSGADDGGAFETIRAALAELPNTSTNTASLKLPSYVALIEEIGTSYLGPLNERESYLVNRVRNIINRQLQA